MDNVNTYSTGQFVLVALGSYPSFSLVGRQLETWSSTQAEIESISRLTTLSLLKILEVGFFQFSVG